MNNLLYSINQEDINGFTKIVFTINNSGFDLKTINSIIENDKDEFDRLHSLDYHAVCSFFDCDNGGRMIVESLTSYICQFTILFTLDFEGIDILYRFDEENILICLSKNNQNYCFKLQDHDSCFESETFRFGINEFLNIINFNCQFYSLREGDSGALIFLGNDEQVQIIAKILNTYIVEFNTHSQWEELYGNR
jgi:hypothetical protein